MNNLFRLIILSLTALLNFNVFQYPQFGALEGALFYVLTLGLPGTLALIVVRLLTLGLTLYILNAFFRLSNYLSLSYTVYFSVLCLWFLEPAYVPFLQLSLPLLITFAGSALFQYLFPAARERPQERSLATTQYLELLDTPVTTLRYGAALGLYAGLVLLACLLRPDLDVSFLGVAGLLLGLSVGLHSARMHTPRWSTLAVITILTSILETGSRWRLSPALVLLGLLLCQYWLHRLLRRFAVLRQADILKLGAVLTAGLLILVNFTPLYTRWSARANTAYLEAQEFYTESQILDSDIKVVTNSDLLRTRGAVAHTGFDLNQIFMDEYLVVLDTTQTDEATTRLLQSAGNFLPVFASSDETVRAYRSLRSQPQALENSWGFYVENYINEAGQVTDPAGGGVTTSEGQAYALWRAAMIEDKQTFDLVWDFTRNNLQARQDDLLFAWRAQAEPFVVTDYTVATDADVDIAYALLLAGDLWGEEYIRIARPLIDDIWEKLVYEARDSYYLGFSDNTYDESILVLNPSYFSPYAYKKFQTVSPRPWLELVDDTYATLEALQTLPDTTTPTLPPNWIGLDTVTGQWVEPELIGNENRDNYGFDAFRTFFRVGLDYEIYKDERAQNYLDVYRPRLENIAREYDYLPAVLTTSGQRVTDYPSVSTNSALVALWQPSLNARPKQTTLILRNYRDEYWNEPDNYYDQNWGWFSLALIEGLFV